MTPLPPEVGPHVPPPPPPPAALPEGLPEEFAPAGPASPPPLPAEVEEEFVGLWRSMASWWGISPTMAEIHGLLFITGDALSADDLMARLRISRGNVSMNLTKLLEWGLVRKASRRGERRDYYAALGDVAEMFTRVAAQRKRREIDPLLHTLRRCSERLGPPPPADADADPEGDRARRVHDLLAFLTLMDSLARRFFESHGSLRAAMDLLTRRDD